jgi:hypothetical protein
MHFSIKSDLRAESSTTLGVAIQLGDDDSADADFFLEGFGLRLASLPNTRVHHENCVIGPLQNDSISLSALK